MLLLRTPFPRGRRRNEIKWKDGALGLQDTDGKQSWCFLGMTQHTTEGLFGLETYLQKYGRCEVGGPDMSEHLDEFDDWYMDIQFPQIKFFYICQRPCAAV